MLAKKLEDSDLKLLEIVEVSWSIFKNNISSLLVIFFILYLPVEIISFFQERIGLFIEVIISIFASIAVAFIVEGEIKGERIHYEEAFKRAFFLFPSGFKASVLAGFMILGLLLLLIVPGIIWMLYYTFFIYAIALRGVKGKAALDYSKALVKGSWWKVFFYILGLTFIAFIPSSIISLPFWFFENTFIDKTGDLIFDLIFSFFTVCEIVFFLNLDLRKTAGADSVL